MIVSDKCYEQYCIYKDRNVKFHENVFHDGKREFSCNESDECEICRNHIITKQVNL